MEIAICDDCAADRYLLTGFLNRFFAAEATKYFVRQYVSAEELMSAAEEYQFDVIFMDIYMRGKNGMEAVRYLRAKGCKSAIVFSTSSTDFAVAGYEVNAAYYLVKPYTYAQLCAALTKVTEQTQKNSRVVSVIVGRLRQDIPLQDILWMEAGDHCAYLHTRTDVLRTSVLLSALCKELSDEPCVIRCNRGVAVNADHVLRCDAEFVYLGNGERVQMNLRNALKIRQEIHDYRWDRLRKQP